MLYEYYGLTLGNSETYEYSYKETMKEKSTILLYSYSTRIHKLRISISMLRVLVRGWEGIAEYWYGTSRPNSWLGVSTSRLQKRED